MTTQQLEKQVQTHDAEYTHLAKVAGREIEQLRQSNKALIVALRELMTGHSMAGEAAAKKAIEAAEKLA